MGLQQNTAILLSKLEIEESGTFISCIWLSTSTYFSEKSKLVVRADFAYFLFHVLLRCLCRKNNWGMP